MRRVVGVIGWIVGGYCVLRAVVEPFLIDLSDPASYRNDRGGPSLLGVLVVHMLPGVLAGAVMVLVLVRRRRNGP